MYALATVLKYHTIKEIHGRDIIILIVLVWFYIVQLVYQIYRSFTLAENFDVNFCNNIKQYSSTV